MVSSSQRLESARNPGRFNRFFGGIADKDVDAGLREAQLLLQQVEKLFVEDDAVPWPIRFVDVANALRGTSSRKQRNRKWMH